MRVVVFMGGNSGEHEVSLRSGQAVLDALAAREHARHGLVFGKTGGATLDGTAMSTGESLLALERLRPDVVFIAMHGAYGEDGRVQGLLEVLGIPYQGSGIQASAIGLDKIRTKAFFRAAGLPVAKDAVVEGLAELDAPRLAVEFGLPLVLKTPASGSSVGVQIVNSLDELRTAGAAMLSESGRLLVEQYVRGREFTAPVVETADGTPEALPIVEIRPRSAAFFDYEAKYTPGATDEICPADIPAALEAELRRLGLAAHHALGCRGYSRTDLMVAADGSPVLLETNTLPGLTAESLLPKSAAVAGLDFPALVERLLMRAIAGR